MSCNYDECLQENPFLQEVFKNHTDIVEDAIKNKWIICVPRLGVFDITPINEEDVLEHVLVPDSATVETRYRTLSKHVVNVNNKQLIKEDGTAVNILFDETVYSGADKKYKLLCLDNSLSDHTSSTSDELFCVRTLRDCVQLLWTTLDEFHKLIELVSFEVICVDVDSLLDKYEVLYYQSVAVISRILVRKCDANNVSLAVETYLQHCTYNSLFRAICNFNSVCDGKLNKIVRNHSQIQLKDLNIDNNFFENIVIAKRELYAINKFSSVLGKIGCLKRTVEALSHHKHSSYATADNLLKIFIFLIFRSNINNWLSNLTYINRFRLSCLNLNDENAFLITTLEAAIEYIKQDNISVESGADAIAKINTLKDLFNVIGKGDLSMLRKFLTDKNKNTLISNNSTSCHPLCSCDKCEATAPFTINSTDDTGSNALHIVSLHGHIHIMEYLIGKGVDFNVTNNSGSLPIHYATTRGHQNALLFLLHSNSAIDLPDCDGNTPLHLAANYGHENCVKALLYFTEQKGYSIDLNCKNNSGDTPLHYASKWSYIGIVQILLEYGADSYITNNLHQNAFDVAHNDNICKELTENISNSQALQSFVIIKKYANGVRPMNRKQLKKIILVRKAIENNDLPLMCFHLGIATPEGASPNLPNIENTMCHPLCTCSKCEVQFEIIRENYPREADTLNVNTCNLDGYTSLHIAAKCGATEIVRLLLDVGALVNLKTYNNLYTPLHLASIHGCPKVIRELLKCNCNINEVDVFGNTALHYACINNNNAIIDMLLNRCGNCNIKNNQGKTPFQLAKQKSLPKQKSVS